jgi:hypothetical protein
VLVITVLSIVAWPLVTQPELKVTVDEDVESALVEESTTLTLTVADPPKVRELPLATDVVIAPEVKVASDPLPSSKLPDPVLLVVAAAIGTVTVAVTVVPERVAVTVSVESQVDAS